MASQDRLRQKSAKRTGRGLADKQSKGETMDGKSRKPRLGQVEVTLGLGKTPRRRPLEPPSHWEEFRADGAVTSRQHRTLEIDNSTAQEQVPHYSTCIETPVSRGHVRNSFVSGCVERV